MTEKPKSKSNHTGLLVALLLVPILYVLSVGPVAMIGKRVGSLPNWIRTFYNPLTWIYHHQPITQKPLEAYERLWAR